MQPLFQCACGGFSRRDFLRLGIGAGALYLLPGRLPADDAISAAATTGNYISNRAPLQPGAYVPLPLGSVRAKGWLLKQLELQRDGLTGHAEELPSWLPALQDSAWMGGKGENWEKGPYYLKGLISLAYGLDDDALKKKAQPWIEGILGSQKPNGFFGPANNNDWWPRMVVTYALRDYQEATNDPRVVPFLSKYYAYMGEELPKSPLNKWGKARAADEIDTLLWVYNRTGDALLLPVAKLLREQAYNWTDTLTNDRFLDTEMLSHNVNVGQALKWPGVVYSVSGAAADHDSLAAGVDHLERDHGLPIGISSGTEHVAGRSPSQGVETCAMVERMLSDETNLRIFGEASIGDNLECVAFNALPGALSDTIQQHVYFTRPNHPSARMALFGYWQGAPDDFVPGPRSGYPCCCYNLHMGWPKYVQNGWAATHDGGLAVLAYGPSEVSAKVANGVPVKVTQDTDYPFGETIRFKVDAASAVQFPLELRIPGWCDAPQITVAGQAQSGVKAGSFFRIDRSWGPGDEVMVQFPMAVKVAEGVLKSITVQRGPLVYSLRIEPEKKILKPDPRGFDQFELTPKTPWNYALDVDPAQPDASITVKQAAMPENPFVADSTPVTLAAKARLVPEWTFGRNGVIAFDPPYSPVASTQPVETVTLVPFGAQFLRITQFPRIGTPATPPASFADDFSKDDLGEHWGIYGAGWMHDQGLLRCRSQKSSMIAALGTDFANLTCDVQVYATAAGNSGLLFRANRIEFAANDFDGYYVGLDASKQQVILGKSDGNFKQLAQAAMKLTADTAYPVRVTANGAKIAVFVDAMTTPVIEFEDSTFASGMVGLRHYTPRYTQVRFGPISAQTV